MRGGNATEKMMKIPTILGLVCGLIGVPAISQADTFLFTVIPSAPLVGTSSCPFPGCKHSGFRPGHAVPRRI